jgi:hypothetical protein
MCNCTDLPPTIATDLRYWHRGFSFAGIAHSSDYFQDLETESLVPALSYGCTIYQCDACGQTWYIECFPEESAFVSFALKISIGVPPMQAEIAAAKQSLSVLAHGGFQSDPCLAKGCPNLRLKGRSVCHLHFPAFSWPDA